MGPYIRPFIRTQKRQNAQSSRDVQNLPCAIRISLATCFMQRPVTSLPLFHFRAVIQQTRSLRLHTWWWLTYDWLAIKQKSFTLKMTIYLYFIRWVRDLLFICLWIATLIGWHKDLIDLINTNWFEVDWQLKMG